MQMFETWVQQGPDGSDASLLSIAGDAVSEIAWQSFETTEEAESFCNERNLEYFLQGMAYICPLMTSSDAHGIYSYFLNNEVNQGNNYLANFIYLALKGETFGFIDKMSPNLNRAMASLNNRGFLLRLLANFYEGYRSPSNLPTLYVDMDGTVAEWNSNAGDSYKEPGYYRTRPVMEQMVKAIELYKKRGGKVKILSAVLQDNHSADDKRAWLKCHMPFIAEEDVVFVPYGENKADYVMPCEGGNILIDDYTLNLETWNGIAVKCLNGINNKSGRWVGWTVDAADDAEDIFMQIVSIATLYED